MQRIFTIIAVILLTACSPRRGQDNHTHMIIGIDYTPYSVTTNVVTNIVIKGNNNTIFVLPINKAKKYLTLSNQERLDYFVESREDLVVMEWMPRYTNLKIGQTGTIGQDYQRDFR